MKKIIVHRLENNQGIGPFRGGHRNEANLLKEHLGIRMCLVDLQGMKPRLFKKLSKSGWLCAWTSESDFDQWMNNQSSLFTELGYFKTTYQVTLYKLCGNQELYYYNESGKYTATEIKGSQVFYNPKYAIKLNN